jgi:hypothetical protein
MNVSDPIRRVSVVSTGQVQIRPDHEASSWRPTIWWLLVSRSWTGMTWICIWAFTARQPWCRKYPVIRRPGGATRNYTPWSILVSLHDPYPPGGGS